MRAQSDALESVHKGAMRIMYTLISGGSKNGGRGHGAMPPIIRDFFIAFHISRL